MAPSEWNQVVELFHAALERSSEDRAVLLDQACGTQSPVRQTVEALLKEHESSTNFLSAPLWDKFSPQSFSDSLAPNQRFGHFVLVEFLGRGGMGEVWSAHDTELDRPVALKFLRAGAGSDFDTGHIAREARAASALNHPNIIAIHELVRSETCSAIVMELVQGRSLATLRGASLPLDQVLSIAAQIAKSLAAAHANRIIHGDIKPENIMLREDGYVKVLDFGLARRAALETSSGVEDPVFGTLRYMSPEQASGRSLTPASDVFSFGLVLFELATGRRAFPEESPLDALRATLKQDPPPPASLNREIPAALNALILAMLLKDPSARPSAGEVAKQLGESLRLHQNQTVEQTSRRRTGRRRRFWPVALIVSLVAMTIAIWFGGGKRDSPQYANLQIHPLTSQTGWEASPALSPDGQSIAFTWAESVGKPSQIYLKQLNDTAPVRLTDSRGEGTAGPLAWSPDGKWIAFKREYPTGSGALCTIPIAGDGNEKKILELRTALLSARIDWSPDGTQLAFSDLLPGTQRVALYLLNLRSGKEQKLTSPPAEAAGDTNPRFSPNGRTIAFKRVSGFWADDIYVVPVAGGKSHRITSESRGIWGHAWTADGKSLILSWQRGTSIFGLWRLPLTAPSHPERIVQGAADAITPSTCRISSRLAWVNEIQDVNIYRAAVAGGKEPMKLIASTARDQHPAYSLHGEIAFVSDRSGSREIWLARGDGSSQKRITSFDGPDVGDLQWSPDGRHLAFYGRAQGHSDIFTLDCDPTNMVCGNPKRVVTTIKAEVPSWSTDGRSLYFASDQTGRWEVWKQAISGGKPVQVTHHGGFAARESADGKWLYFSKDKQEAIWRMPIARAGEGARSYEELVIGAANRVQQKGWALIPGGIVFMESTGHALRVFQFSTKRKRLIAPLGEGFSDGREYGVSVSADSKWVLYEQLDRSGSNIMVAEAP